MNPADTLPLRDIHLPDAVSWWPPAPGWWILLLLGLVLIAAAIIGIRKLLQPKLNKSARAEVEKILNEYEKHGNPQQLLQQISAVIRRIGISYLTRDQYAGLVGAAWYRQINQLAPEHPFSPAVINLLVDAPYQKQPQIDTELVKQLIVETRHWVQALPTNPSANTRLGVAHV